jgi:hypothetical protein
MSQPPKSTILAPKRRCTAFKGVLRSTLAAEVVADSILYSQAESDTNMRSEQGSKQRPPKEKSLAKIVLQQLRFGKLRSSQFLPHWLSSGTVFWETSYARTDCLRPVQ